MRLRVLLVAALCCAALGHTSPKDKARLELCPPPKACRHVYDVAAALPPSDIARFDGYMDSIQQESDVDVRFVFVPGTGGSSIEELAVDIVDKVRIGGRTGDQRGILLIFDMRDRRLKVEVGYGLEGHFPDAFVSYLVHEHARIFFESGDLTTGLRLMLRLLQHRIREAVLGNDFDPRVLRAVKAGGPLSGGAGVASNMPSATDSRAPARMSKEERARYRAGSTPAETFAAYLEWLAQPLFEPDVDLFTAPSRPYLGSLPLTPAYRQFILFGEHGKRFEVVERGRLALMYFTSTPLASPHFFVKEGNVWRMDVLAEVRNTRERVGGAYTWDYRGEKDRYSRAFSDLVIEIRGLRRIKNGDNRPLAIARRMNPSR